MTLDFEFSSLGGEQARQGTRGNRVFDAIRQAIVQLRLRPGNLLSEAEVARQLGVSRQPVREAFIKLSENGLVRVLPQRGTFVVKISAKSVTDARFVREAVECAIARRDSEGIGKTQLDDLRAILAEQRKAARDPETFFVLDEAFHRGLANAADCAYAWKVIEEAEAQMDRVRFQAVNPTFLLAVTKRAEPAD